MNRYLRYVVIAIGLSVLFQNCSGPQANTSMATANQKVDDLNLVVDPAPADVAERYELPNNDELQLDEYNNGSMKISRVVADSLCHSSEFYLSTDQVQSLQYHINLAANNPALNGNIVDDPGVAALLTSLDSQLVVYCQ